MEITISQAALRTGLSEHTLRYYDREGLLPFVDRAPSGRRIFKESDFRWLKMITCLKRSGMQVKQIKQYIDWCIEGDSTMPQRLEMFYQHKQTLEKQMKDLRECMDTVENKIDIYKTRLQKAPVKTSA